MSYLMKLCGFILAVLGLALVAVAFVYPGRLDIYGLRLDTAAVLLVGGILALGLSGVIDALKFKGKEFEMTAGVDFVAPDAAAPSVANDEPLPASVPEKKSGGLGNVFGRKSAAVAAVATEVEADPVAQTITALDEAKAEITRAMGGMDNLAAPTYGEPAVAEIEEVEEVEAEIPTAAVETDLYVLEEKVIRGRPARILSDETVEAETDEGWMRFENLEHLNEYLDSVEEQV